MNGFPRIEWHPEQLTMAERRALINLLAPSVVVLFLALVPLILSTGPVLPGAIWRWSNGILGVVHLALVTSALVAAVRGRLLEPVPVRFVLIPGGYLSGLFSLLAALGYLPDLLVTAYVTGLVWSLFVAAVQFVMLIVPRPTPS